MLPVINHQRQSLSSKSIRSIFSTFCLLIVFASVKKQFTVASHNLHSFKKSSTYHKQCIQNLGGLWMAQELWLPERRLSDLSQLGVQFVARSGMDDAFSHGIYNGRPYGGVSIAWSPDMDHLIRPLRPQKRIQSYLLMCICLFSTRQRGRSAWQKQLKPLLC